MSIVVLLGADEVLLGAVVVLLGAVVIVEALVLLLALWPRTGPMKMAAELRRRVVNCMLGGFTRNLSVGSGLVGLYNSLLDVEDELGTRVERETSWRNKRDSTTTGNHERRARRAIVTHVKQVRRSNMDDQEVETRYCVLSKLRPVVAYLVGSQQPYCVTAFPLAVGEGRHDLKGGKIPPASPIKDVCLCELAILAVGKRGICQAREHTLNSKPSLLAEDPACATRGPAADRLDCQ